MLPNDLILTNCSFHHCPTLTPSRGGSPSFPFLRASVASNVSLFPSAKVLMTSKTRQSWITLRPRCALPSPHSLAIGDAAYRQNAGGGPNHGHRQHTQKFGKDRGDILADRQTHRQTYSSQYFTIDSAGEVMKHSFGLCCQCALTFESDVHHHIYF